MAVKKTNIAGIGEITLYKRRGTRNLRLRISQRGEVAVTLPTWVPYGSAIAFVQEKQAWIIAQKKPRTLLSPNARIGKAHRLVFNSSLTPKITTRVTATAINISLPPGISFDHPAAQAAAEKASVRALKQQANKLLPQRLAFVAAKDNFKYRSIKIKQLKGRWGSCNQQSDIVLNCFLMQLPWDLIDYVILHELTHTQIMAHGRPFWLAMSELVPNLPEIRRIMRAQQPCLLPVDS